MKDFVEVLMTILGAIAFIALIVFVMPFVHFWVAYFGGWITMKIIGVKLTDALNILFNTQYFKPQMLPMMAGALGWIGGFFKSISSTTNKND